MNGYDVILVIAGGTWLGVTGARANAAFWAGMLLLAACIWSGYTFWAFAGFLVLMEAFYLAGFALIGWRRAG